MNRIRTDYGPAGDDKLIIIIRVQIGDECREAANVDIGEDAPRKRRSVHERLFIRVTAGAAFAVGLGAHNTRL